MFITLEGIDFSGKTTIAKWLEEYFVTIGKKVIRTKEPGGTELGEEIRKLCLNSSNLKISDKTLFYLFLANRIDHIEKLIKPKLEEGFLVICDRFFDSTIAYQIVGSKLDLQNYTKILNIATEGFIPDLTLFLDLDPTKAFKRMRPTDKLDYIESKTFGFFETVYDTYNKLAEVNPHRISKIDASSEIRFVFGSCSRAINDRMRFLNGTRLEDTMDEFISLKNIGI